MSWEDTSVGYGKILVTHYIGDWTLSEFETALSPFLTQVDRSRNCHVLIHDLSRQSHVPLELLPQTQEMFVAEKPRFEVQILVGISAATVALFHMFLQTVSQEIAQNFTIAETMEIALLRAHQAVSAGDS